MQDMPSAGTQLSERYARAWDLPTRVFHWTLLILVVFAWISFRYAESLGDPLIKLHRWNGLAILTLLVWRLAWGIFGSSTSRFANFVASPRAALGYGVDLMRGGSRRFLGHNPLGGWMVVALLATLAIQAGLGLFTVEDNDIAAGPLYRLVSEAATKTASRWHHYMFDFVLLPLVVVHVLANVGYGIFKREPLIGAMITGRKPHADYVDAATADIAARPILRALALLAFSALLVLGTIRLLSGRFI